MGISTFTTASRTLARARSSALSRRWCLGRMWDMDLSTKKLLVSKTARDELEHTFIMMVRKAVAWVRVKSCRTIGEAFIGYTSWLVKGLEDQKRFRQKFLIFIDPLVLNNCFSSLRHSAERLCGQRSSLESMVHQITLFNPLFLSTSEPL